MTTTPHIAVLCSGNICRSPMAEHIWRAHLPDVRVSSAGVRPLQPGDSADPGAVAILERHGYTSDHRVRGVSLDTLAADLILIAEPSWADLLVALGAPPANVRSITAFDPLSDALDDVANPYGEPAACFQAVLGLIERCVPALQQWRKERP